ncbi:MAG: aconitase family protein [Mangrovicoccus sp.]|nr:aconitase family protein [Mangrovicoccus sp.]
MSAGRVILAGDATARVLAASEGLSFWGGVEPASGRVIDAHHPLFGACVTGTVLMLPTSRGSCTGSGVLLDLALNDRAPAALVFRAAEDVLTLGAMVAARVFGRTLPVVRLEPDAFDRVARASTVTIAGTTLTADGTAFALDPAAAETLDLTVADRAMLAGRDGEAVRLAMEILVAMAAQQGATRLTDVTRAHIDGCIYASPANLTFAEMMARLGAAVRVPTTMNAISVDHAHWRGQGVPESFGDPARRLADAYVTMGAEPTFTCAPYLLDPAPGPGEAIGWSESNAVIYANSVLGARTVKHPDFLDLFIALTGRAPLSGVYLDADRAARRVIAVDLPEGVDDAVWPLIGYLAGLAAPDRIPLLTGLAGAAPSPDDLKALCAAFGTSSAAPMLHIEGVTPEAAGAAAPDADRVSVNRADLASAWAGFNTGAEAVDLVAFGSPHASLAECRAIAALLGGTSEDRRAPGTQAIVTLGRAVLQQARAEGVLARLEGFGIRVIPDLCWCSISEPVFPPSARTVMTNSGKYAHYGPALTGRQMRFGSLADCVAAARTGRAPHCLPDWLDGGEG